MGLRWSEIRKLKELGVLVVNLATLEERIYSSNLTPEQAVIAAYAQSQGDFNTWEYESKYGDKVIRGNKTVSCGDWCALL